MNWIKERRERLGLTQEQLVARIQLNGYVVSRGTLSHWEMGKTPPPLHLPEFTNALAGALKMPVLALLKQAGYKLSDWSESAQRAAEYINELPKYKQESIADIVETLYDQAKKEADMLKIEG